MSADHHSISFPSQQCKPPRKVYATDIGVRRLTVACSCGAATHTFTIAISAPPLTSHLCSCDTSRRISGSLITSYINIKNEFSNSKPELSQLTPYHSSNKLTRHFCSNCGTHMYLEYRFDGHFEAATGTLQVHDTKGVVKYESCMWVEDTKDGGASDWLGRIDGTDLRMWTQEASASAFVPTDFFSILSQIRRPSKRSVRAHCHCNGVEFWIQYPNAASKTARSDFPDLMKPYHLGPDASTNSLNKTWWLRNGDTRFLAGTCACLSCRRASGFDITFWAFIPTANIFLDSDLTQPFPPYDAEHRNKYWGTMKTYQSSPGVTRTFCGKCGATVFWDGGQGKGRDGLVDVAVGLLDAETGARAEELLEWWPDRVSFEEFAVSKGLVEALGKGLKDWKTRSDTRKARRASL